MADWYRRESKMTLLENETIRLRALEPEDLELLYHWENDSSLWQIGTTVSPFSRYVLKEYIAESHRDIYDMRQLRLMIDLRSANKTIGMVDLFDFDPHNHRAGIGILIDSRYQKQGFATSSVHLLMDYAFNFLKIHQLYVHIPIENEASKTLFSHCGFKVAGILREWISTSEGYSDVMIMQHIHKKERDGI